MPVVHHAHREITLKLVYCGPGLGGKTTNLVELHTQSRPDRRGKLVSVMSDAARTVFFDFMPLELGDFRGYRIRTHVCSVPGQLAQEATRRRVLQHVDGIIFVVDSQPGRLDANTSSLRDLESSLLACELELERMPLVVQYNKRDLPESLDVEELRQSLGVPEEVVEVEASARLGWGVFETLKATTKECLRTIGDPEALSEGYVRRPLARSRPRFYPAASRSMIQALKPPAEAPPAKSGARD